MNNHDDFQIELGQTVRRHIEHKVSPLRDSSCCALPYDEPKQDETAVFISENVMRQIEALVARDKEREVGGVLLGGFFRSDNGAFLLIDDFIEAKAAQGTDVSLTFTHESWEQINAEQAARGGNSVIVGWYHSHPALGVFMSHEDEFIHTSFFTDPSHVALVVDPIYHNWGVFTWKDGAIERAGGFYVYSDKRSARRVRDYVKGLNAARRPAGRDASAMADRQPGRRRRSTAVLWAVIVLLLIAQGITAYLLFADRSRQSGAIDYTARATQLLSVSDLTGGEQFLRMALVRNPKDTQAEREFRRLGVLYKTPGIRPPDGPELDRTNFLLANADEACSRETEYRMREDDSVLGMPDPFKNKDEYSPQLATQDPKKHALKLYEEATASYALRLERAKAIRAALRADRAKGGKAWYDEAVTWLEGENLRRIAYGRSLAISEYSDAYRKLSARDKKRVDKMRERLRQ